MAQQREVVAPSDTRRSLDWHEFPVSCLGDIFAAQTPVLHIRPKSLGGLGSQHLFRTYRSGGTPKWVPDPRVAQINCRITCAIYENEEAQSTQIAARTLTAMVAAVEKDGDKVFSFQMQPFRFPMNEIPFQRKGSSEQPFRVKFDVECDTPRDVEQLMKLLDEKHNLMDPSAEGDHIYAAWTHLPRCPTGNELLHLHRGDGSNYRQLRSRLVVDMKWHRLPDTPLTIYFWAKPTTKGVRTGSQQSVKAEESEDIYRVSYTFMDAAGQHRALTSTELRCPLCCRSRPHSSFDRLHCHFLLNHEHLQFAVKDGGRARNTIHKTVQVTLADKSTERAVNGVVDEMNWIRPARPFDLAAYLGGDHSWTSAKDPPRKKTNGTFTQVEQSLVVNARYKDPSAIGEIASKKRKRYTVPSIPGVTLYRNISKRRIEPGEVLSESDDDVDCSWLQVEQKRRKIDDLSESAEYMLKLFDAHMDEEDLNGDLYLSDALVRFCRQYKDQLASALVFEDFREKLKQLHHSGLIPQEISRYCLDFLRSASIPRQYTRSEAERLDMSPAHFSRRDDSGAKSSSDDVIMVDSDSDSMTPEHTAIPDDQFAKKYLGPLAEAPVARILLGSIYGSDKVFLDATIQVMAQDLQSQEDIHAFRNQLGQWAAKRDAHHFQTPVSDTSSVTSTGDVEDPIIAFLLDLSFVMTSSSKVRKVKDETNVLGTSDRTTVGRKAACDCGSIVVGRSGTIVCASSVSPSMRFLVKDYC